MAGKRALKGVLQRRLQARAGALWQRIRATLRPPGHLVVLLGPDGCGKTTTAALMAEGLARCGIPVTAVYLGAQKPLLPTRRLSQRLRQRFAKPGAVPVIRDVTRQQRLRGLLHVLADQWLRYLVYVRPRLVRGDIVVLDRYFYDLRTYQHPLVRRRWVEALAMRVIPRPALAFCLTASPSVIAARKGELTVAETARQLECYRGVGSWLRNFYEVPADGDLRSVVGWMNDQVIRLYAGSPPEEGGTVCTLAHMSAAAH
jgi:thymidylate kinase